MTGFLRAIRRLTRLAMLCILILTACSAWTNYQKVLNTAHILNRTGSDRFVDSIAYVLKGWVWGGPAAISIFDFEILDPVLGIISILSVPETSLRCAGAILIPIFLSFFFGRVFCGYICPVGWFASVVNNIKQHKYLRRINPASAKTSTDRNNNVNDKNWGRVGWLLLAVIIVISISGKGGFTSLALVHLQVQRIATWPIPSYSLFSALGALSGFFLFELFIASGVWCRYLCPTGKLSGLMSKKRFIGVVKKGVTECPAKCALCNDNCRLHLKPRTGNPGAYCDLCMKCAAVCPKRRLKAGIVSSQVRTALKIICLSLIIFGLPAFRQISWAEEKFPLLDRNPPWSTRINKLDGEVWKADNDYRVGLSVSFVEKRDTCDLYIFSAYIADNSEEKQDGRSRCSIILQSGNKKVSLDFAEPNAPRSTPDKIVYSGRAWVETGESNRLKAVFPAINKAISITFPETYRRKQTSNFFFGFCSFMIIPITGLIFGCFYRCMRV